MQRFSQRLISHLFDLQTFIMQMLSLQLYFDILACHDNLFTLLFLWHYLHRISFNKRNVKKD